MLVTKLNLLMLTNKVQFALSVFYKIKQDVMMKFKNKSIICDLNKVFYCLWLHIKNLKLPLSSLIHKESS